jgi:hypothetical protein
MMSTVFGKTQEEFAQYCRDDPKAMAVLINQHEKDQGVQLVYERRIYHEALSTEQIGTL